MSVKSRSKLKVTRRHVIAGMASVPFMASFKPNLALANASKMDQFIYASSILCGIPMDKSYIQLSHQIWQALTLNATDKDMREWTKLIDKVSSLPANANSARINKTLRLMGRGAHQKARLMAKVWYTGRIARPLLNSKLTTFEVINYDEANVWIACDFTKPPVTCGGHFGYWQHPYTGKV
ncbi:MAG: hypothetical protein HWE30_02465 [Methylocystaceae bacterium]|nr:hypothetical protein [Methylocystaceae bacterium]